ncbi:hypothetical protein [Sulfitobacter sp. SH24]|uniref:glycine-rich domain-containing protein n=1 Tax=Sulfitobacter sp. SH24 TaxID=3421173 RepID=UPI003F50639A
MTRPIIDALSEDVPQNGQPDAEFDQNADRWVDEQLAFQEELNIWGAWAEGVGQAVEQDAYDAGQAASSAAEDAGFALQAKDDAEDARDIVVPLSEQFGATYLGAYNGAPLVDKNGDPLADGMLYTELGVSPGLKLRSGGVWGAAAVNANGAFLVANNLSEGHAPTMRANLGLTYASETEAQEGTGADKSMTPLRVAQAIAALGQIRVTETVIDASTTFEKEDWAKIIVVEAWGGGEGGAQANNARGGKGGGYILKVLMADDLSDPETVTIGDGGAASPTGIRNAGGNTTLGSHVVARGGGWNGIGTVAETGIEVQEVRSPDHGGADGGGPQSTTAGVSLYGGNGGAGENTGAAGSGLVPGGGGGSTSTSGTSGSGGKGKMIIWQIG